MIDPEPEWWPDGADEWRVRECALTGCEACAARIGRLDESRAGPAASAASGQDRTLDAFAGEGVAD